MIRKFTLIALTVLIADFAAAQFDPSRVNKSLVRVVVSINNRESSVCTGFVWKTPNQIVTSLHAMSPTGVITVLYLNQAWRKARIKKVLAKADLVLLELVPGESDPPAGVIALTSFNGAPIKFGTDVFAMGYNNGAPGSSSRTLKKGFVDPETLDYLIPKGDKAALAKIGFPALDLHILYLEGSLLPGYSGSPVFDPNGSLIGIGDGGLERGASNVSWIIPAKFLTELEASTSTALPANFSQLTQLFSASAKVELSLDEIDKMLEESGNQFVVSSPDVYREVNAAGFDFYLTKNRSLYEMVETSDDPANLEKFTTELEDWNIAIDYEKLRFDIYEDINYGVVLAVPEGKPLYYYEDGGYFATNFAENNMVGLMYYGAVGDNSYTNIVDVSTYVQDWVNTTLTTAYGISGFTLDEEYSYWLEFEGGRKIAWMSMMGNDPIMGLDGSTQAVGLYLTLLMTEEKSFLAISSFLVPAELLVYAQQYGIDCSNPDFALQCRYFESLVQVFCAAHLTTFSY